MDGMKYKCNPAMNPCKLHITGLKNVLLLGVQPGRAQRPGTKLKPTLPGQTGSLGMYLMMFMLLASYLVINIMHRL